MEDLIAQFLRFGEREVAVQEHRLGPGDQVGGTPLGGLIGGILLARTFSGVLGQWLGWRVPYLVAAVLVLALALVLRAVVPQTTPATSQSYPSLLTTSIRLLGREPELRRSCLCQALAFAGFSGAWTAIALLVTGPTYCLGASMVGVIALVGAVSVFCTPIAGRMSDRHGSDRVNLVCLLGSLLAAAVLLVGGRGGGLGLASLFVGMLLLDVAFQGGQVANQTRIFALEPALRSRLNTAYMTCSFLGGSAGSWLAVRAYTRFAWNGTCFLVMIGALIALARHLLHLATAGKRRPPVEPRQRADATVPSAPPS